MLGGLPSRHGPEQSGFGGAVAAQDVLDQVAPISAPRELDMLLSSGERISMALLAMAIHSMGFEARSFTGSQAGMITDAKHGAARIVDVTPVRLREALDYRTPAEVEASYTHPTTTAPASVYRRNEPQGASLWALGKADTCATYP